MNTRCRAGASRINPTGPLRPIDSREGVCERFRESLGAPPLHCFMLDMQVTSLPLRNKNPKPRDAAAKIKYTQGRPIS